MGHYVWQEDGAGKPVAVKVLSVEAVMEVGMANALTVAGASSSNECTRP